MSSDKSLDNEQKNHENESAAFFESIQTFYYCPLFTNSIDYKPGNQKIHP
jgi:hypothetical protein